MMQTYAEYKDSGVDWLGEIPAGWTTAPIRSLFTESRKKNCKLEDSNYLSLMAGVGVIPYAEKGDVGNKMPEDLSNCKIVAPDDFVLNSMNFGIGSFGRSKYQGVCSSVYVILKAIDITQLSYFERVFQQPLFQKFSQSLGNGILAHRCAIGWNELKNERFPVPPSDEMFAIAGFLEDKTAKIDELVGIKRRQITLLGERKQILIQNAVTKGLNPDAPLKDSGVDWIGNIPAHWEVKRLKFLCSIGTGERNTEDKVEGGKYPFFVRSQTAERINSYSYDGEAILTAGDGAGVGKVYHYVDGKFDFHQRVYKFSDFSKLGGKYLFHYISRTFYSVAMLGTAKSTVDSLRLPLIQNFWVPFPPDHLEQEAIVDFIDEQSNKINAAITIKQNQITKLNEYKTTLINAAVTGKIKVA